MIALRAEIQQAVNDGWPVRAIWQTLRAEGAVQVGYHAFRRHVAELVLEKPTERGRRPTAHAEPSYRPAAPVTRTEDKPRAFHHDRRPRMDKIYG